MLNSKGFTLVEGKKSVPTTQVIIAAINEEEGIGLTIAEFQKHLGYPNVW